MQGSAAPAPDAAWNRRQFSAIWAPLPYVPQFIHSASSFWNPFRPVDSFPFPIHHTHRGNYTFVSTSYALGPIPETPLEAACPFAYTDDAL